MNWKHFKDANSDDNMGPITSSILSFNTSYHNTLFRVEAMRYYEKYFTIFLLNFTCFQMPIKFKTDEVAI